ncbi:MAG TPA: hypothetical protein DCR43_01745 [Bacteroidales bacterium]|nr:MAG: hypothetical protein A2X11_10500 [Bacteroidetes bacterium GWE2_42_24]OFY28109.1 MAG: hypothetical protein A2X09_00760 [Bacteroidetes bacterium GWF2_43_11]HAQ64573.1 hypothetical protein [Bacteroidales bacterium]HBZ65489.1 hypothetical protein [Bacteroidales bacterium]
MLKAFFICNIFVIYFISEAEAVTSIVIIDPVVRVQVFHAKPVFPEMLFSSGFGGVIVETVIKRLTGLFFRHVSRDSDGMKVWSAFLSLSGIV